MHEGGIPADGEAAVWPDRQPQLCGGPAGQRRAGQLRRQQGRRGGHDQVRRQGAGRAGRHRQRGCAGLHRHRYDRRHAGEGPCRHPGLHPHGEDGRGGGRGKGRGLLRQRQRRLYHRAGAVRGRRHGHVM